MSTNTDTPENQGDVELVAPTVGATEGDDGSSVATNEPTTVGAAANTENQGDIELTALVTASTAGGDEGGVITNEPATAGTTAQPGNAQIAASAQGSFLDLTTWSNRLLLILLATAVIGVISAPVFLGLYINQLTTVKGGDSFPTPVILKISSRNNYPQDANYMRMFLSGYNESLREDNNPPPGFIMWRNQSGFWYLEVLPLVESFRNCPTKRDPFGSFKQIVNINPLNTSSCNLYDFRLVIFNDLNTGATIHFHGLNPPSNQDGVPFVANANINPQNLQRYRFNQFTYPGLRWMHAHTGFQQAYGVSAPIVMQHSDGYDNLNGFSKDDDLVVMLEDSRRYPKCAYAGDVWFNDTCKDLPENGIALLINRREEPLDHILSANANIVRLRFLNGGSLMNWQITTSFADKNDIDGNPINGKAPKMQVSATDGMDVVLTGDTVDEFPLGLANRIDVLVDIDPDSNKDYLITAVQMAPFGDLKNPGLRHIVIRGRNILEKTKIEKLPTFWKNGTQPKQSNFNLVKSLSSVHPLLSKQPNKTFSIWNRGGNLEGGFPLEIFKGEILDLNSAKPLYEYDTYTKYNNLKFQLPPYKVFRHNTKKDVYISTTRKCTNCSEYNTDNGLRFIPNETRSSLSFVEPPNTTHFNETCCWEWCDFEPDECKNFILEDVTYYEPNKNFIPVCYGDRVRILFVNTIKPEGHPIHLHGHEFVIRNVYAVNETTMNLIPLKDYPINGPTLDTVYIPASTAVAIEFDALNPGEHLLHCHIDDHLTGGMLTTLRYMHDAFCNDLPEFVGGENSYPTQFCPVSGNCPEPIKTR